MDDIIGLAKCKKHPFLNGTLVWKTLWLDVLCGKIGNKSEAERWQKCNANPFSMRLEYVQTTVVQNSAM